MSNYTIAVNWAGKDALSDSDPAKVVSGSDFNTEFTTVQTAVNTKADLNGSSAESFACANLTVAGTAAFTGVPTAPTAAADTNTTQIATTAYVQTELSALGTNSTGDRTIEAVGSNTTPTGGNSGDIIYRY